MRLPLGGLWQRVVRARRLATPRDAATSIARTIASSSLSSSSSSSPSSAVAAVFDAFGEPSDVLRVRELPLPTPGAGQVLLALEAVGCGLGGLVDKTGKSGKCSSRRGRRSANARARPRPSIHNNNNKQAPINPSDVNTIQGRYPLRPEPPSAVPGHEGVFRVVESGGGGLRVGDRVVPLRPALGTWRSRGVFDARDWHRVPPGLPLAAAATLCVNPPTALALLEDFVDVFADARAGGSEGGGGGSASGGGTVVVQTGATSAVGQLVAQLARHRGARTVNIVRDRPDWDETRAWLESLGADAVTTEARARADAARLGLPPAALALDCVGGGASGAAARLLGPGGTLVCYGAMSLQPVQVPASLLIFKDVRVRGFWLSGGRRGRRRQPGGGRRERPDRGDEAEE